MTINNLLPVGLEAETADVAQTRTESPVGFRPGVAFAERGDFTRDGRNQIEGCTGVESWKSWARNCLQTERYAHLAYSSDFGIEIEKAFSAGSRAEAESILTRQINDALLADPYGRTQYIEDITFNWTRSDAVEVEVIAHGLEDVTIDVTAYLSQGGG